MAIRKVSQHDGKARGRGQTDFLVPKRVLTLKQRQQALKRADAWGELKYFGSDGADYAGVNQRAECFATQTADVSSAIS
jgi:hypothetical protein